MVSRWSPGPPARPARLGPARPGPARLRLLDVHDPVEAESCQEASVQALIPKMQQKCKSAKCKVQKCKMRAGPGNVWNASGFPGAGRRRAPAFPAGGPCIFRVCTLRCYTFILLCFALCCIVLHFCILVVHCFAFSAFPDFALLGRGSCFAFPVFAFL